MDGQAPNGPATPTRPGWRRPRRAWAIGVTAPIGIGAVVILNAGGQPAAPWPPLRAAENFSLPQLGGNGTTLTELTSWTGRTAGRTRPG